MSFTSSVFLSQIKTTHAISPLISCAGLYWRMWGKDAAGGDWGRKPFEDKGR